MQWTAQNGPQAPTFGDASRLLSVANTLHLANPRERMGVLAGQVLDLMGAKVAAVFGGKPGSPLKPLLVVSDEPRRKYQPPAPQIDSPLGVVLLPPSEGGGPEGIQSIFRETGRVTALMAWRARPFTSQHITLLQLLHPAANWAITIPTGDELPAGTEAVLDLMLTGITEREIARRLGRSMHTVHAHVKRVYRHYSVSSRPELLARLQNRR